MKIFKVEFFTVFQCRQSEMSWCLMLGFLAKCGQEEGIFLVDYWEEINWIMRCRFKGSGKMMLNEIRVEIKNVFILSCED